MSGKAVKFSSNTLKKRKVRNHNQENRATEKKEQKGKAPRNKAQLFKATLA